MARLNKNKRYVTRNSITRIKRARLILEKYARHRDNSIFCVMLSHINSVSAAICVSAVWLMLNNALSCALEIAHPLELDVASRRDE